ncbi:MAG: PAS domain S-box protein [Phycisphaerales bacterium]|nr:PAS domain S-box protein [Phycisphaerales bacterium]
MSSTPPEHATDGFYRRLFEQAGMAMVAADPDGRIIGWNHAAARMFGAGAEEMVGADWWHVVPNEQREELRSAARASLDRGETTEFNFASHDEHGAVRQLAVIVTPIVASGERVGVLAVARDISNRVLLQKQLTQQSKMASLGEMAGALSHHFNNILGGVVTSVDFALASRDPNVQRRVMEKTAQALTRATSLVENLLAFAEGDYRDANLGEIGEVVIELARVVENRLRGSNITLIVDIQPMPIIEVPRNAMLNVLTNLADNAIEAMPEGGTLRIAGGQDGDYVVIRVADTGCGLDEQALTRIFEPFYSTKRPLGSSESMSRGLGLAVAHGILKVLHGTIHVTSTVGVGTELIVRLPVSEST